jgi:hypothetical protein
VCPEEETVLPTYECWPAVGMRLAFRPAYVRSTRSKAITRRRPPKSSHQPLRDDAFPTPLRHGCCLRTLSAAGHTSCREIPCRRCRGISCSYNLDISSMLICQPLTRTIGTAVPRMNRRPNGRDWSKPSFSRILFLATGTTRKAPTLHSRYNWRPLHPSMSLMVLCYLGVPRPCAPSLRGSSQVPRGWEGAGRNFVFGC